MSLFVRRYLVDPGLDVLLQIEAVNILDLTPPAAITAVGTGTVLIVGEFENGPYNEPSEVSGATDLQATFGGVGYASGTLAQANNPCARKRFADGALAAENWNGNALLQLSGKKFSRLQVCRVDTSVGKVQFTALAALLGASSFRFGLTPGSILGLDLGAGEVTATFDATAATVTAVGATYPTGFVGGETLSLGYDDPNGPNANFVVTFLAGDTSLAAVIARINLYAGFAFADNSGGQLRLTGRQMGLGAAVRVVGGSAGVLTALGLTAASTPGTGNVQNIAQVTPQEVSTIVEGAIAGTVVETLADGTLRVATTATSITVGPSTTATALGLAIGATATAANPAAGLVPAGTIVQPTGAPSTQIFVTAQDLTFAASGVFVGGDPVPTAGPWSVPIRHATDDGTGLAATAGSIVQIVTPSTAGAFSVTNPQAVGAALTETQIDLAYQAALDATLDPSAVTAQANIVFSARQSNSVRKALRANALTASANGLYGRVAIVRSPLGTPKGLAQSTSAEPGVGAYRDQRVIYVWPGANTYVPAIAAVGLAGGAGFTADGNIDIGADGFLASVMSQINPEQNPGEANSYLDNINSLDTQAKAQARANPLVIGDYIAFKRAGICALRIDAGTACFQSGVTSVNPLVDPALVNINRRRMADFIQDSLAVFAKSYGKKVNTQARRKTFAGDINNFLSGLLSKKQPANQRIAGYTVDDVSGNTATTLAMGIFRVIVNVRTLSTMDVIVIATTVGEQVEVVEQLPQTA